MDLPRAAPAGYPAPLPRPAGRQNILNTRTPGKQLMVRVQHVGSYYAASSQRAPERPALADGIDCDVCVVGAGIAGCSTALHLALAGLRVVLLEEQRVGWGASGRSGAQAIYGIAAGQTKLARLIGAGAARAVWDVSVEGLGVRIFEGTRATGFAPAGASQVHIRTPRGEVRARYLALCGNVYLGATAPTLASKIMAVATYIVATAPLGAERARQLITNNAAVSDMNWVLDYFRRSADHRLLFGGRVNYSGFSSFDAPSATRARMLAVFPQLQDVRIEYAWGGEVDITLNRAPHFGRLAPNVYFVQGFSGHGIALTGIAGKLVAEAITGIAGRFDVFARIPHRNFPGGTALRRPALVLAMLYYRLRDLL